MIPKRRIVPWCIALQAWAGLSVLAADAPALEVRLALVKPQYVLGEPMELEVTATNVGVTAISAIRPQIDDTEPEIRVCFSLDGESFASYRMGLYPDHKVGRGANVLPPRSSWSCRLRVLYTSDHASGLALELPGQYFVKAVFPLVPARDPASSLERHEFTSNTVSLRILPRTGLDADIWDSIGGADFAYFLQCGRTRDHNTVSGAIRVLRGVPASAYHPHIRRGLEEWWAREHGVGLTPDEKKYLQALGIDPHWLFPDDQRLDTVVTYESRGFTPLGQVLSEFAKQSGVPLALDPELSKRRMGSGWMTCSLRDAMDKLSAYKSTWRRHGEGYILVPGK